MLLLSQERILRDLKQLYAHQMAKLNLEASSKEEIYNVLTFYHMNRQIINAINEFEKSQNTDKIKLTNSSVIHLLSAINGSILSHIDQVDEKYSDAVFLNATKLTIKTRRGINE